MKLCVPYDLKVVKKTKPEREYISVTSHQDSHPLLAGMLFGTNSIENNLAIPIKIINSHTFWCNNSICKGILW